MRTNLRGHAHAARLGPANQVDAAAGRDVHHVHAAAGGIGQRDVAGSHDVFGRGRHARQTQDHRDEPFVHDAALGQLAHFGMIQNWLVEHLAVFECPAHQLGVVDRGAIVAEGHGAGLHELANFGQFLAFAILADAGHDEHVALIGPGGQMLDELDRGLGVDRRLGVGNAGDRSESAGDRGAGAGEDGFVLFATWLAEVHMHVDQARRDDLPLGVDRAASPGGDRIERGDTAILDQ